MSKLLAVLSFASWINGSTTASVWLFTVVVVPLTVKSPAIVTSRPVVKSPFLEIVKAVTSKAFASETLNIVDWVTPVLSIKELEPSECICKLAWLPNLAFRYLQNLYY